MYGSSLTLLTAVPRCAGIPALCLDRPSWERPSASVAEFTHTHMCPDISGTERVGFSKQDAFRLLPKVSGANIHWANRNDTFLTHKNPRTDTFSHDISPAKLCSTAWVWNPQGISKLVNKVDCWVPHALLKAIVRAFLATKSFTTGSSTYPCHMVCVSKSVPKDVISLSDY